MSDVSMKARAQFTPRGDAGRFVSAVLTPGIIASVRAAQGLIVQEAQSACPVRTGALRESIAAVEPEETGKTVVGEVVAAAPYAGYVEYGTGRRGASSAGAGPYPYNQDWPGMVAQPFMRPALDTTRDAVREIFSSNLSIGLQK